MLANATNNNPAKLLKSVINPGDKYIDYILCFHD